MIPHSLNLTTGNDLLLTIKEYAIYENIYGFVSGIVGNLSNVSIQCPINNDITKFKGEFEIITLNGYFDKSDIHLHLSFSDDKCKVYGGHLEEGTIIKKGANIFLLSFENNLAYPSDKNEKFTKNIVEIYVLDSCPWSKRAIRLLNSSDVKHKVIYVKSDQVFKKVNDISNNVTFPQIFINNKFFGGFDELLNQFKIDSLDSLK